MGLSKNSIFALIFLSTTMVFSFIGYKPIDVVIGGPNFPQIDSGVMDQVRGSRGAACLEFGR